MSTCIKYKGGTITVNPRKDTVSIQFPGMENPEIFTDFYVEGLSEETMCEMFKPLAKDVFSRNNHKQSEYRVAYKGGEITVEGEYVEFIFDDLGVYEVMDNLRIYNRPWDVIKSFILPIADGLTKETT